MFIEVLRKTFLGALIYCTSCLDIYQDNEVIILKMKMK